MHINDVILKAKAVNSNSTKTCALFQHKLNLAVGDRSEWLVQLNITTPLSELQRVGHQYVQFNSVPRCQRS